MAKLEFPKMFGKRYKHLKPRISRKNLIITVVALVEVFMLAFTSVFAWIETTSSIQITNSNIGKIGGKTYQIANIDSAAGTSIDLSQYFNESGNVHLSRASSADGKSFYFPKLNASSAYRKGTVDDINVNYISFSLKITTKVDSDFYFNSDPVITIDNTEVSDDSVRLAVTKTAIDADGNNVAPTTKIFNKSGTAAPSVSSSDGSTATVSYAGYAFANHTVPDNVSATDKEPVFTVEKDNKETLITFTLWLEKPVLTDGETLSGNVTVTGFNLVTKLFIPSITFVDKTANHQNMYWVDDSEAKMYVYDKTSGATVPMTKTGDHTWKTGQQTDNSDALTEDFLANKNADLYFVRRSPTATSAINLTAASGDTTYWNCWQTKLSDAEAVSPRNYTFTAFVDGYGTWGNVTLVEFDVESSVTSAIKKPTETEGLGTAPYVTFKFIGTDSNTYQYYMNYNNDGGKYSWKIYLPNDIISKIGDINAWFYVDTDQNSPAEYTFDAVNQRDSVLYTASSATSSATTGYWTPPATVTVGVGTDYTSFGSVSVTGGATGSSTVKVSPGTEVTLTATPNTGYDFVGWYTDAACTTQAADISATINSDGTATAKLTPEDTEKAYSYYAKFQLKTFTVAVTATAAGDSGGMGNSTVSLDIDGTTHGPAVSVTLDGTNGTNKVGYGSTATFKAIADTTTTDTSYYRFEGWYTDSACTKKADDSKVGNDTYTYSEDTYKATVNSELALFAKFFLVVNTPVDSNYHLMGTFADWDPGITMQYSSNVDTTSASCTVNINAGTYQFKINEPPADNSGKWYASSSHTSESSALAPTVSASASATLAQNNDLGNMYLKIATTGNYKFTFNTSTNLLTIECVSSSGGGTTEEKYIYFNNTLDWEHVYVYLYTEAYWDDSKGTGSLKTKTLNDGAPYEMKKNADGFYELKYSSLSTFTHLAFTDTNTQTDYGNFWYPNTNSPVVAYAGAFDSAKPLYTPGSTIVRLNQYDTDGVTRNPGIPYFTGGSWAEYTGTGAATTKTVYVCVINHFNTADADKYYLYYGGGTTEGNVLCTRLSSDTTIRYMSEHSGWGEQTFNVYTAEIPTDSTKMKFHIDSTWIGESDADAKNCSIIYIYNYSYNRAIYD